MMKKNLRRTLLAQRDAIAANVRARHDQALCAQVIAWWTRHPVRSLGVYWPIRSEPDLRAAYAELSKRGVQLALPVVTAADAPLLFAQWAPGDALTPGFMQVPEPAQPRITVQPEALLIPCVGFNRQGNRLGYGGGFYDRTLANTPRPLTIGIAYGSASAAFPAAQHDIALDAIITEDAGFTADER